MGTTAEPIPAGWFLDPAGGGGWRYWDGQQWTEHRAGGPAVGPGVDLPRLEREAGRAIVAMAVGVPVHAGAAALQVLQVRQSRRAVTDVRAQFDAFERQLQQPGTTTGDVQVFRTTPIYPVGSITGLPTLVIGIIFVIWFHRAATTAVAVRRPARRSPGWAVGGWFIPIGNLFLPYRSARDLFRPRDESGRRTVGRWWTAYLVAGLALQPVTVIAGLHDAHTGATAIAVGALASVLWLWTFFAARTLVEEATASLRADV